MQLLKCFCGNEYNARQADINRGWAKACSKSCAATKREFNRPNPKLVESGEKVKFGKKPDYKVRNKFNSIARAEIIAKQCGYYPFDSEDEMYEAMCDNPAEGR